MHLLDFNVHGALLPGRHRKTGHAGPRPTWSSHFSIRIQAEAELGPFEIYLLFYLWLHLGPAASASDFGRCAAAEYDSKGQVSGRQQWPSGSQCPLQVGGVLRHHCWGLRPKTATCSLPTPHRHKKVGSWAPAWCLRDTWLILKEGSLGEIVFSASPSNLFIIRHSFRIVRQVGMDLLMGYIFFFSCLDWTVERLRNIPTWHTKQAEIWLP